MIIPSLHRQPVPVSLAAHRTLRLQLPLADCRFAETSNALFIAAGELGQAVREFPVVFVEAGKDEQGRTEIAPIVVCGVVKDQNLYVEHGEWRARYLPAVLRLYPFCIGRVDGDRFALGMDAQCSALSETAGEPLFSATGEASATVRSAFESLQAFDGDCQRTRLMCGRLRDLGLLQPSRFDATLDNGATLTVDGFFTVEEKKFAELPDADIVSLHRDGTLGMVHAHHVSLGHFNRLVEWHAERLKAAPAAAPAPA